jgi:hypothetical protein
MITSLLFVAHGIGVAHGSGHVSIAMMKGEDDVHHWRSSGACLSGGGAAETSAVRAYAADFFSRSGCWRKMVVANDRLATGACGLEEMCVRAVEKIMREPHTRRPILDTNPNGLKIPREALLPKPPEEYEQRLARPSISSSKWNIRNE